MTFVRASEILDGIMGNLGHKLPILHLELQFPGSNGLFESSGG